LLSLFVNHSENPEPFYMLQLTIQHQVFSFILFVVVVVVIVVVVVMS